MGQIIAAMLNDAHNNGIPLDSLPHIQDESFIKYILLWRILRKTSSLMMRWIKIRTWGKI